MHRLLLLIRSIAVGSQFAPGDFIPGIGQVVSVSPLGIITFDVGNGQFQTFNPSDLPTNQKRTLLAGQNIAGLGKIVSVDVLGGTVTVDVGNGQTQIFPLPLSTTSNQKRTLVAGEVLPGFGKIVSVDTLNGVATVDVGGGKIETLTILPGPSSSGSPQKRSLVVGQILPGIGQVVSIDALSGVITINSGGETETFLPDQLPNFDPTDGGSTPTVTDPSTDPSDENTSISNSKRFIKRSPVLDDVSDSSTSFCSLFLPSF